MALFMECKFIKKHIPLKKCLDILTFSLCWALFSPWIFVIANALHFNSNSFDLKTAFTLLELLATQQIPSLPSSLDAPVKPHLHIQLAPTDFLSFFPFLAGWKRDWVKFLHKGLKND